MKIGVTMLFAILWCAGSLAAQSPTPTPAPAPRVPTGTRLPQRGERPGDGLERLRSLEIRRTTVDPIYSSAALEVRRALYRKPTKEETLTLAVAQHLNEKYASFLESPRTGIVRLSGASGCGESTEVVSANCVHNNIPGAGTAFSFRFGSYRLPRLADLILSDRVLKSDGAMQQAIMVRLGDVPLEQVTLDTKGLKYLVDFEPGQDKASLLATDIKHSKGVRADGFVYGLGFYVSNDTTFALRSIAYRGTALRSVDGFTYNELDFDKRRDILVAFRIVDVEPNGNITIIWKVLADKKAPGLSLKEEQAEKR